MAMIGACSRDQSPPRSADWPEQGLLGTYDRPALKRGYQVYRQVCSACHALHLVSYPDLAALGYSEAEIAAFAADAKAPSLTNEVADPPDLSLIVRAREGHEDYVYSLLTGYRPAPPGMALPDGLHYNDTYPGHLIAMPPPLGDGQVDFGKDAQGRSIPDTTGDEAKDVVQFLAWASEPHLEERHRMGIQALIFLGVFAGLMYAANRRIWRGID